MDLQRRAQQVSSPVVMMAMTQARGPIGRHPGGRRVHIPGTSPVEGYCVSVAFDVRRPGSGGPEIAVGALWDEDEALVIIIKKLRVQAGQLRARTQGRGRLVCAGRRATKLSGHSREGLVVARIRGT